MSDAQATTGRRPAQRGWRAIASNIAGTPNMKVTRWRSISSSVPPGSNAATRTQLPPLSSIGRVSMFSAAMWNSGAATRVTSSPIRSGSISTLTAFQVRLAWVSIAPFGRPVVPEVYMIMQVSSSPTGSSIGSAEAAASRFS